MQADDEDLFLEILDTHAALQLRLVEEILKTGAKFDFGHFWEALDIHIPKDGKMELSQCQASLNAAAAFFPKHFPEKPFRLFTLCTWFVDAQLQCLLPKNSNIVRLQKEFYLLPVLSNERPAYERVFGSSTIDMAGAPDDTTLRKAIKQFVLAGGRMRYNAGFILPEDLGLFGGEHYQTASASFIENSMRGEVRNGHVGIAPAT